MLRVGAVLFFISVGSYLIGKSADFENLNELTPKEKELEERLDLIKESSELLVVDAFKKSAKSENLDITSQKRIVGW